MNRRTLLTTLLVIAALVPLRAIQAAPAPCEPLLVLAAADLQYAMGELADAYGARGCRPTLSFGSSGSFAQQIEAGAPADLYFSADESYVVKLEQKGLTLAGTRQVYAIGRIVLTPAPGAGVPVQTLRDLTRPEIVKVAIANPEHAPYGRAAKQALQDSGLWDQVSPKLVYGENISQTFQLVRTGNADAGIVALSVALGVPGTPYALLDDKLHQPLVQAAAVLARSGQPEAAKAFLAYVNGPEGRPVMKKYGFVLPNEG